MGIKKLDTIWIDGQLIPWDSATEHLLAHTMHYGVGAFEGIRAYQRTDGRTQIFRLREHIERLLDSSAICTMDVPFTRDQLMAKHQANHIQVAYAPSAELALRALVRKASMAQAMGMRVNICGDVHDALDHHQPPELHR